MPALFTLPKQIPLSTSGALLPSARLYFFQTGTTTPQDTFQDEALTTPHAHPVVADSAGVFAPIYLDPAGVSYRVRLSTSADVQIYQVDGVPSNQSAARTLRLEHTAPEIIWSETDASSGNQKWRIRVNAEALTIDLGNDAESVWSNVVTINRTGTTLDEANSNVALKETGTFTGTLTGFGSTVQGTISYNRVGTVVTLWCNSNITGTSNATSMSLTGLPAALQPANTRVVPCVGLLDNAGQLTGWGWVAGSAIEFHVSVVSGSLVVGSQTGFTNSGTKGLAGDAGLSRSWNLTYDLG